MAGLLRAQLPSDEMGCEDSAALICESKCEVTSWRISDKCRTGRSLVCCLFHLPKLLIEFEPPILKV